jgi:hypothetical protein
MPTKADYQAKAATAVAALFPNVSEEARAAIAWLIVDFLLSLDAMTGGGIAE